MERVYSFVSSASFPCPKEILNLSGSEWRSQNAVLNQFQSLRGARCTLSCHSRSHMLFQNREFDEHGIGIHNHGLVPDKWMISRHQHNGLIFTVSKSAYTDQNKRGIRVRKNDPQVWGSSRSVSRNQEAIPTFHPARRRMRCVAFNDWSSCNTSMVSSSDFPPARRMLL